MATGFTTNLDLDKFQQKWQQVSKIDAHFGHLKKCPKCAIVTNG
jgi:hypothetical protein